ncbi:PstS family phosphate ABC transporter substrate-binding protein [Fontivita pretiosa]|uniref:PstS family phosphate ABC transporter substrate-binding protein n=1 Tax=Fontivita pretiosa TaxID=2989684 RepID=UPI003D18654C
MLNILRNAACAAMLVAAAFGLAPLARAESIIRIDGSSTVYPITEAVAEEFQKSASQVKVTVGISGTGGGFKKFVRGETDISDASRPILQSEIDQARQAGIKFIEIPVAFDALTVVVNPANNWVDQLTVEELKKMWQPDAQGKITNWNQIRSSFPKAPLKLYGAGSDSGTFDYFTEAIVGKSKASRGDYTASEDDNVLVQGIASDPNALGYFGYAYYAENRDKLKAVPIVNREGRAVLPSPQTVKDGSYNPLSRPIFIYVNAASLDRPEVYQFVKFYLENATDLVKQVKYVPLPEEIYHKALERVEARKTGTIFGGREQVGMKIEELFAKELKE